jgi:hypothetical protein
MFTRVCERALIVAFGRLSGAARDRTLRLLDLRVRVEGARFRVAWRSDAGGLVPVIVGDSVFAITRDGTLNQLRLADGRLIASTRVGAQATSFRRRPGER